MEQVDVYGEHGVPNRVRNVKLEKCPSYRNFQRFNLVVNIQHTDPSGKYWDALAQEIPIGWALSHVKYVGLTDDESEEEYEDQKCVIIYALPNANSI